MRHSILAREVVIDRRAMLMELSRRAVGAPQFHAENHSAKDERAEYGNPEDYVLHAATPRK
jgi:hypothetical protein